MSTTLTRRSFVRKLGLSAAAATALPTALAACGNAAATPRQEAPGAVKRGGTLVVSLDADATTLNPITTPVNETYWVSNQIFDTLLRYNDRFEPIPGLARSWTTSADGRTYEFTLATGVKWHDGTPFSSADVKFTFEVLGPKYNPTCQAVFANLSSVDASDPNKVTVELSQPSGALLSCLGDPNLSIMPQHLFATGDPLTNPANSNPVGTGAFKLKQWTRGQSITLERNADYWEKGLPYLDQITFQITPNPETATSALEQGEIGFVLTQIQPVDVKRLSVEKALKVVSPSVLARTLDLWPNLRHKPLNNLKVRQALSLAMDRPRMVTDVAFGTSKVARSPLGSKSPYFDKSLPVIHRNVRRAGQLLDQAGYKKGPGGTRFSLVLRVVASQAQFLNTAQIVKENLQDVGIEVNIIAAETATTLQEVFDNWNFDLAVYSMPLGPEPSLQLAQWYGTKGIDHAAFSNAEGYSSSTLDALISKSRVTVSRSARTQVYAQIQQLIMADLPSIPLWEVLLISAYRTQYQEVFTQPDDRYLHLLDAWKSSSQG